MCRDFHLTVALVGCPARPTRIAGSFLYAPQSSNQNYSPRCVTCRSTTKRPCPRGQRAGTWPIHGASCWHTTPYVGWLLIPRLGAGNLRVGGFFRDPSHSRLSRYSLDTFYHDPTWRRRRDFRKDVLKRVCQALDAYCDQVEAAALAAGLKRAPRHREVGHFDWLVSHQIKGESFASIATHSCYKFTGGRQTVRKAVVELAKYIELNLRSSTSASTR
jgi:hypothetical protein